MKPKRRGANPNVERLRLAIEHDGRTKEDIAKSAGLPSRQVLTNILGGHGGGQHVDGLAKALKVSARWLIAGEDPPDWYQGPDAAVARLLEVAGDAAKRGGRVESTGRGEAVVSGAALDVYSPIADLDESSDGAAQPRFPTFQLACVVYAIDRAVRDAAVPTIVKDGLRGAAMTIGVSSLANRFAERARKDQRFTYVTAWNELVAEARSIAKAVGALS